MTTALLVVSASAEEVRAGSVVTLSMNIDAKIDNNYATTTISQELKNEAEYSREAEFDFTIPENAFLSQFELVLNGTTHKAKVVTKEAADEEYEAAKEQNKTASTVGSSSSSLNSFNYKINIKPGQTIKYNLVFEEYLTRYKGNYTFTLPMSKNSFPSEGDMSVNVEINTVAGIKDLSVNSAYDVTPDIKTNKATIAFSPETRSFSKDMIITYNLKAYPKEGYFLNYEDDGEGYFFHVFCPAVKDIGGETLGKDIIFIIDQSGSMNGDKMTQAKDAFQGVVSDLKDADRFNILKFSTSVESYKEDLIEATPDNIGDAKDWISTINAGGGTNINQAMLDGLAQFPDDSTNVPIICFLTDGLPSVGVQETGTIRTNVKTANTMGAAVFTLAFGNDCDDTFLNAMALENNGHGTKVAVGTDASDQIKGYYDTFSTPLVSNLNFDYGEKSWDVFPVKVPSLYQGSEVVVVGRYDTSLMNIEATVNGSTTEGMTDFGKQFPIVKTSSNSFIPRYWAFQKINDLLELMIVEGETPELKQQVTNISLEYQFVTKYTSMILVIDEDPAADPEEKEGDEWFDDDMAPLDDAAGAWDDDDDSGYWDDDDDDDWSPASEEDKSDGSMGTAFGGVIVIATFLILLVIAFVITFAAVAVVIHRRKQGQETKVEKPVKKDE